MTYWGYHLMLDCSKCDPAKIQDPNTIKKFVRHLVERIDMVAYGQPILAHFATHDREKAGYSLCQLIETSNITAHFVDQTGDAYIDIFSCRQFDIKLAEEAVRSFFSPTKVKIFFLTRNAE